MVNVFGLFNGPQPAAEPDYSLGDKWTPNSNAIDLAGRRLTARRNNCSWQAVTAAVEKDSLRIPILFATEGPNDESNRSKTLRKLRQLAFDPAARFFKRRLSISRSHYLIELRHPELIKPGNLFYTGIRFIALDNDRWQHGDSPIGALVDGTPLPFTKMFHPRGLDLRSADQVESYVQFVFRHMKLNGEQLYMVSAGTDFLDEPQRHIQIDDRHVLAAQFHKHDASANTGQQTRPANMPPDRHLIPPTFLGRVDRRDKVPEHATVFATIIFDRRLYHVGLEVMGDGSVSCKKRRPQTPKATRLPITSLRSFADQKDAIEAALGGSVQAGAP